MSDGGPRRALGWDQWWPALRTGLWALALFALGIAAVKLYAQPIRAALLEHALAGMLVFFASSALAVLLPMLSNLPLLPAAVLAWGAWPAAALLLGGWVAGAAASFILARHARTLILARFPGVLRHADIDRLIHPQHRIVSLVMLRMTFPVDVLSYALGLFSRGTTLAENMLSTALGGAPFAILFTFFSLLDGAQQLVLLGVSSAAFVAYAAWVLRRGDAA